MKLIIFLSLFITFTQVIHADDEIKESSLAVSELEYYKSTYFALNENGAKFQLSLKWQIIEDVPLFFGYTQYSVWDVFKDSSPFREIAFNPDLFYRFDIDFLHYSHIDLGIFEHNSNGRDGIESRSYNQSFLRLISKTFFDNGFGLILENKLYVIYDEGEFNSDIKDFLGSYEVTLRLQNVFRFAFEDDEIYFRYVPGKDGFLLTEREHGFYNVGFRFRFLNSKLLPAFLIDYYSGFSETLLDYNKESRQVRFGIMKSW